MIEQWSTIPAAPAYEVSNLGRVRRGARELNPWAWSKKTGHRKVSLHHDGKRRDVFVHRLVAEAFVPKTDPTHTVVRHIVAPNRGGSDAATNLTWGTQHDNIQDRVRHDTGAKGADVNTAKLTEDDVRAIRAAYAAGGISMAKLGARYGVTNQNIFAIVHRTSWKHVH